MKTNYKLQYYLITEEIIEVINQKIANNEKVHIKKLVMNYDIPQNYFFAIFKELTTLTPKEYIQAVLGGQNFYQKRFDHSQKTKTKFLNTKHLRYGVILGLILYAIILTLLVPFLKLPYFDYYEAQGNMVSKEFDYIEESNLWYYQTYVTIPYTAEMKEYIEQSNQSSDIVTNNGYVNASLNVYVTLVDDVTGGYASCTYNYTSNEVTLLQTPVYYSINSNLPLFNASILNISKYNDVQESCNEIISNLQ